MPDAPVHTYLYVAYLFFFQSTCVCGTVQHALSLLMVHRIRCMGYKFDACRKPHAHTKFPSVFELNILIYFDPFFFGWKQGDFSSRHFFGKVEPMDNASPETGNGWIRGCCITITVHAILEVVCGHAFPSRSTFSALNKGWQSSRSEKYRSFRNTWVLQSVSHQSSVISHQSSVINHQSSSIHSRDGILSSLPRWIHWKPNGPPPRGEVFVDTN